ncbi:MAG: hypothetical protein LBV12_06945 [Puniceicoccales bacterium]|jgi:probable HAF family extracellular repeat protein|nr:hypothetical protein [Puniceicoccales bacterium]
MQNLGTLGGNISLARSINDKGQVTGYAYSLDGKKHAFIWTKESGMQKLDTLGGIGSDPRYIDDTGFIIGLSESTDGTSHVFQWNKEQGMQNLGVPAQDNWDKNPFIKGQILGTFKTPQGATHAYLWTKETGIQDLGDLGGDGTPHCINSKQQIVGTLRTKDGNRAFFWSKEQGLHDLGTLGLDWSRATSINNQGQITGTVGSLAPWWVKSWNWVGKKLDLSQKYFLDLKKYAPSEAALWFAPPPLAVNNPEDNKNDSAD